ncbi:hypothetical protein N9N03_00745 [Chlamydiia bacterium]|nr:hypothetical protein [Chlamydiia bacterium]
MFSFFKRFFLPQYSSSTRFLLTIVSFVIILCSTLLLLVFASVHSSFSQRFLRQIDYVTPVHSLTLTKDSINRSDWEATIYSLNQSELNNRFSFHIVESRPVSISYGITESEYTLSSLLMKNLSDYLDLINTPDSSQLFNLVFELCKISGDVSSIYEHITIIKDNRVSEVVSINIDETDDFLHIVTLDGHTLVIRQNETPEINNHDKPTLSLKGNNAREKFNQFGKLLKKIEEKHSNCYLLILPTTSFLQTDIIGKQVRLEGLAAHDNEGHIGLVIGSFDCGYSSNAATTLFTTKRHFNRLPFLNNAQEKPINNQDEQNMRRSTYYGTSFMSIGIIPKNVTTTNAIQTDIVKYLVNTQTTNVQLEHKLEASVFDEFKQGIHTEMMISQGIVSLIILVSATSFIGLSAVLYEEKKRELAIHLSLGASHRSLIISYAYSLGLFITIAYLTGYISAHFTIIKIDTLINYLSYLNGNELFNESSYGHLLYITLNHTYAFKLYVFTIVSSLLASSPSIFKLYTLSIAKQLREP